MSRRRAINRKRKFYVWGRKLQRPRYLLRDLWSAQSEEEQFPIIDEREKLIPIGREIT